jgi:hypothetical protein
MVMSMREKTQNNGNERTLIFLDGNEQILSLRKLSVAKSSYWQNKL